MKRKPRIYYSDSQKALMWERWRRASASFFLAVVAAESVGSTGVFTFFSHRRRRRRRHWQGSGIGLRSGFGDAASECRQQRQQREALGAGVRLRSRLHCRRLRPGRFAVQVVSAAAIRCNQHTRSDCMPVRKHSLIARAIRPCQLTLAGEQVIGEVADVFRSRRSL